MKIKTFKEWLVENCISRLTPWPIRTLVTKPPKNYFWPGITPPAELADPSMTKFECLNCKHSWGFFVNLGKPSSCPRCGSWKFKVKNDNDIDIQNRPTEIGNLKIPDEPEIAS